MNAVACPHGDPTCPCAVADACRYEGEHAFACLNPPPSLVGGWIQPLDEDGNPTGERVPAIRFIPHCHVEGCRWRFDDQMDASCGLIRLGTLVGGVHVRPLSGLRGTVWWPCGAMRAVVASGLLEGRDPADPSPP